MPHPSDATLRSRLLILAPAGRDGPLAQSVLARAGLAGVVCSDLSTLVEALQEGAGAGLIAEEALQDGIAPLIGWIEQQPSWSDFPFILLLHRGGSAEHGGAERHRLQRVGNPTSLDRPVGTATLVSTVQAALRARGRQYEVHDTLQALAASEARHRNLADELERLVAERTHSLAEANAKLSAEMAERQRTEEALRQAQKLEAIGQLTSGVAHDFNNLLTAVLGNLELVEARLTDSDSQRLVRSGMRAAQRGASLTQQLLAFSRKQRLVPQPLDLNRLVRDASEMLTRTMRTSVTVEITLEEELWPALVDPTQIELVLLNLAINARDAMPDSGTLTVCTANVSGASVPPELPRGDYVMISVKDNGSGMSPEVLAKAVDPFFTTKDVGKGSGLGLSMVHGVASQSGGCLRIESAVGQGTNVRVYLPRALRQPEQIAAEEAIAVARHDQATILVVDDDPDVRELTVTCLHSWGYRILVAENGLMALDILVRAEQVDLLIVDLAMPGMNGVEVVRRARELRPGMPALLVTGYVDFAAFETDPGDFILHKPYRVEKLAEAVATALDSASARVVPMKQPQRRKG
jgi:signal transduction histidine kinase/ActR/RegA family two-component response regulator